MPQRIRDLGVAALLLAALFAALTGIDNRVPTRVVAYVSELADGRLTAPDSIVGSLIATLRSGPAANNIYVAAFLATAVVLVYFMTRMRT